MILHMGHAHWSLDCACCSAMGIRRRTAAELQAGLQPSPGSRVDTAGLDHLYAATREPQDEGEPALESYTVEISDSCATASNTTTDSLLAVIREQNQLLAEKNGKLEAAGYRIGFLEGLIESSQAQINLIPDLRSKAALCIVQEHRAAELESRVADLEAELACLRAHWWNRFMTWFLGARPGA